MCKPFLHKGMGSALDVTDIEMIYFRFCMAAKQERVRKSNKMRNLQGRCLAKTLKLMPPNINSVLRSTQT
jgi:hypothetical protein